ncbi:MAG: FAD-dependent oxidoreductase [SAR324 cluster bacterium]|nr:FAD-dependent oxidoreductase [SAR324 cluster bacterium]
MLRGRGPATGLILEAGLVLAPRQFSHEFPMADNGKNGNTRHVTVIGAGIVGVCCGLYLLRDGHKVTLMDAQAPGEGASFGSAGFISPGSCVPIGMPGLASKVPGMLMDPLGPLTIRWRYLPRIAPWLLRFLAASSPKRVEEISLAMRALYQSATEDFQPLVGEAKAANLVRRDGRLEIYRGEHSLAKAQLKYDIMRRRGVTLDIVAGADLQKLEPALAPEYSVAVRIPDSSHTTDPFRLTEALAKDFQRQGGTILREKVLGFDMRGGVPAGIIGEGARRDLDALVVAAGAYSGSLARQLGSKVPLDTERGYHMMLPEPGIELRFPISSGDHHFAITPMDGGIRLAGTVEFAGLEAAPNYARADKLYASARLMFPGLQAEGAERWMGRRPSLPDSLPVISRSPVHPSVFYAFGHGHLGLTGAAVTGKLIAELVTGKPHNIDLSPYRVHRF